MKKYWFTSIITLYIVLGLYVLSVSYSTPLVGVFIKEENEKFVLVDFHYKEWAEQNHVEKGDILLEVNHTPVEKIESLKHELVVRTANHLSIQKRDGQIHQIDIRHLDLPQQFYMMSVVPSIYFIVTILSSIYLYRLKRYHSLLYILICFLFSCSIAYIGSGASGRGDELAWVIISSNMILCLVILIHFLKQYYDLLQIRWIFIKNVAYLYALPVAYSAILIIETLVPTVSLHFPWTLFLFSVLLLIVLIILVHGMFKYRLSQLTILFIGLIVPFLPFLLLFVLPELLFQKPILASEISSLFLLLIPFNFIFTQLTERLFDIQYHLSRIRYYGSLAFITSFITTLLIQLLWQQEVSILEATVMFGVIFITVFCLLYVKERVDFHQRKILFTTHGDSIHGVYSVIQQIGKATNQEQLLQLLTQTIKEKLTVDSLMIEINHFPTQENHGMHLTLGEIKKDNSHYYLLLHSTPTLRIVLCIGSVKQPIQLKKEEIVWLELIAVYCDVFLHNLKRMEDLIKEITDMKAIRDESIPWLDKLVWQFVEQEKSILAQELHDTILQEQLYLSRELDLFMIDHPSIQQLEEIRNQLLDTTYHLREYCESLNPPLLDTLGLEAALKKMIQKVKMRANFILHDELDELLLKDSTLPLIIYRIVQELLNNAMKHSEATEVTLNLSSIPDGLELYYEDNGIGFDFSKIETIDSMGIRGIHERVKAFNGTMDMQTSPSLGMKMTIQIIEESGELID